MALVTIGNHTRDQSFFQNKYKCDEKSSSRVCDQFSSANKRDHFSSFLTLFYNLIINYPLALLYVEFASEKNYISNLRLFTING